MPLQMDLKVPSSGFVIPPEKRLRGHLFTLSQSLSPCLVEKMTTYLFHTRTITAHEVGVIKSQPTGMQKAAHLIQVVLRKGGNACLLFYQCLGECNPDLFEKLTGAPAIPSNIVDEQPSKNNTSAGGYAETSTSQFCSSPERTFTPHAPAYIINIHNSTLRNCIIGNHSGQNISTEQEHLWPERQDFSSQETIRTSLMSDQQRAAETSGGPHNIQVHGSHMEYVIIGNQSSMVVNTTQSEEDGEEEDDEEYQESSNS